MTLKFKFKFVGNTKKDIVMNPVSQNDDDGILSVRQVAQLMNTSRQNIFDYIYRGRITAQRKTIDANTNQYQYQITPAMLAELAQSQANDLIGMLGVYMFAEILHSLKKMNDEQYNNILSRFKTMLKTAHDIPALTNVVNNITNKMPSLRD